MKIRISLFLAAALLAVGSCTKRPVRPDLGTTAIDTLISNNGLACKVEYRFATIRNAAASPALEAIEQANIGYFFLLEGFSGTPEKAAQASLHEIAAEYLQDIPEQSYTYEYSIDSEISVTDTLLTCVINRWSYLGGAHGMYGTECHTYSLADGYEYELADLFSEEEQQNLAAAIHAKLCEEYEAADDEALSEAGFFPEYIAATENFILTPEGMTFHFNPYEIGCYALGSIEVSLTNEEIGQLRK